MPFQKLEPLLTQCPLGIAIYEMEVVDGYLEDMTLIWINQATTDRYTDKWVGASAKKLLANDWEAIRELVQTGNPYRYSRVFTPPDGVGDPFAYTAIAWCEPPLVGVMVTYEENLDAQGSYVSKEVSDALREIQQRSKDTLALAQRASII